MLFISPNNEYPRHYGDIQIEHPSWELGDELPEGWHEVERVAPPEVTLDQIAIEEYPILVNGAYQQKWQVRNLTADEIERRDAPKTARAKLLALGLTEAEIRAITRNFGL